MKQISDNIARAERLYSAQKLIVACACTLSAANGCDIIGPDSPTNWTQAAPVQMAGNGAKLVFKSPAESYNAPLSGGPITFAGAKGSADGTALKFSYLPSKRSPRNDVVTLTIDADTLTIDGRGRYQIGSKNGASLSTLPPMLRTTTYPSDRTKHMETLSISGEHGRYRIEARGAFGHILFTGTAIPTRGIVYLTKATFSTAFQMYAGTSQHDVGNWNNAADAAANLQRVESTIPT